MSEAERSGPGLLGTESECRELLQSIVELTRSVFAAKACSIMRHDETTRELVFEAVAGEGAGALVGQRIADNIGIAGWSLASEEPIAIADVVDDPRFARDIAERTGYVPTRLTVYPLLSQERSLGVLNVLDQGTGQPVGLADMNVLARIATHAAHVLSLVQAARESARVDGQIGVSARIERSLRSAGAPRREAALAMLTALEQMLDAG
jgi:GAF domain-containing protein